MININPPQMQMHISKTACLVLKGRIWRHEQVSNCTHKDKDPL